MKSRRDISVGHHPVGAIAVDFDHDGILDIVTVDQMDDQLGLVKGFGDGTFRRVKGLAVGSLPTAVAAGDANGDGNLDLVTANLRSQEIGVNLSDGQGDYLPKIGTFISGFTATALTVGDWNGDGRMDAAMVAASLDSMVVLLGDGTGHFGAPVSYPVGANPKQVLSADFNRDGFLDLAVVGANASSIQVWRGNGAGAFTLQATLVTGTQPQGLSAVDLDGDGDLDLVVCNYGSDTVGVYLNNGSGAFGSPTILSPGFGPRASIVADINKDGKLDLLVTLSKVSGVGQVATLLGTGAGGFGAPSLANCGPVPNTATIGDFNLDDNLDLVTVNLTGNSISVLQNTGSGAFLFGGKVSLTSGAYPQGIVTADFNRDGKADLASANQGHDDVSVAYGDGAGGFGAPGAGIAVGVAPTSITVEDYNRDNFMDMATANNGNDTLTYIQGNGTSFNTYNQSTCVNPVSVSSGDISGDLRPDLVVVCEGSNQMCTRRSTGANGNSAFGASVCTTLPAVPTETVVGNFNGDAFADAAISFSVTNTVSVEPSNGTGGVGGAPVDSQVGLDPSGLARADIDGDGVVDLVVADSGTNSISVLLRGTPGTPPIDSPAGLAPTALVLADFNLDGKLDVATANTDDNNVSLLLGDGTGHFLNTGYFGTRDLPVSLAAGDFNGDGKPDLVVADSFSDSVTVLINQSWSGDPLSWVSVYGASRNVFRWGIVPGAVYDVIRGDIHSIVPQPDHVDLGPVLCLADDFTGNDTAAFPDDVNPPENEVFFYLVRSVAGGVAGDYTVSSNGRIGRPTSGDCNN